MIENRPDDVIQNLVVTVDALVVKERRLMKIIQRLEDDGANTRGLMIESITITKPKREFDSPEDKDRYKEIQRERVAEGKKLPGREVTESTTSGDNKDLLLRAHAELRMTVSEKKQVLNQLFLMGITLERIEFERRRIENDDTRLALEKAKVELYRQRALGIIDLDELIAPAVLELDEPGDDG